jgi:hypothetical protein
MRASYFLWGALAIGVGVSLFLLKYKVQALENELIARQEQVIRDRSAIRVLQAEWTYLNDPERLRRLSAEHLGFAAAAPRNITTISALPFRVGVDAPAQLSDPESSPPTPQAHAGTKAESQRAAARSPLDAGLVPVLLARLQLLLFPASAGAATLPLQERAR